MPLLAVLLLLQGCDSVRGVLARHGFDTGQTPGQVAAQTAAPQRKGELKEHGRELTEFDVLGVDSAGAVYEEDIRQAAAVKSKVRLASGASLMLVQSGAAVPDDGMTGRLARHYRVAVFSGVADGLPAGNYGRALRLAAARAGCDKLVVYWNVLEVGRVDFVGKVVSWTPMISGTLPERPQTARMRIRMAVVDVPTGQWDVFSPPAFTDVAGNEGYARMTVGPERVESIKDRAYAAAVEEVVERYAR